MSALILPIAINNAIANPPPALIPNIPGSAIGFFVTLCTIAPLILSAAPAKIVIIIRGNLKSNKISSSMASPCPIKVLKNLSTGMLYSPEVILQVQPRNSRMLKTASAIHRLRLLFELIILSVLLF
ncbi:Uncharacterised protein [Staphylococcus aureus]|nr:Uncharacterised protein [Staphylococcus aureus]